MEHADIINKQVLQSNLNQQQEPMDLNQAKIESSVETHKLPEQRLINPHSFTHRQKIKKNLDLQSNSDLPIENESDNTATNSINQIPMDKLPNLVEEKLLNAENKQLTEEKILNSQYKQATEENLPNSEHKKAIFNQPIRATETPLNVESSVTIKNTEAPNNLLHFSKHSTSNKEAQENLNSNSVESVQNLKNEV